MAAVVLRHSPGTCPGPRASQSLDNLQAQTTRLQAKTQLAGAGAGAGKALRGGRSLRPAGKPAQVGERSIPSPASPRAPQRACPTVGRRNPISFRPEVNFQKKITSPPRLATSSPPCVRCFPDGPCPGPRRQEHHVSPGPRTGRVRPTGNLAGLEADPWEARDVGSAGCQGDQLPPPPFSSRNARLVQAWGPSVLGCYCKTRTAFGRERHSAGVICWP